MCFDVYFELALVGVYSQHPLRVDAAAAVSHMHAAHLLACRCAKDGLESTPR